jgi:hypothetical protein
MHPEPSNSNTVIEVLIPDTLYTQHSNRIPECEVKIKLQRELKLNNSKTKIVNRGQRKKEGRGGL